MTKQWERIGEWAMRRGPWRIAKSIVGGVPRYTLTHDTRSTKWCGIRMPAILGIYQTATAAMEAAK